MHCCPFTLTCPLFQKAEVFTLPHAFHTLFPLGIPSHCFHYLECLLSMPGPESSTIQSAFPNFYRPNGNSLSASLEKKQKNKEVVPRSYAWTSAQRPESDTSLTSPRGQGGSQYRLVLVEMNHLHFLFEVHLSFLGWASVTTVFGLLFYYGESPSDFCTSFSLLNFCNISLWLYNYAQSQTEGRLAGQKDLDKLCFSLLVLWFASQRSQYLGRELKKLQFWFKSHQIRQ